MFSVKDELTKRKNNLITLQGYLTGCLRGAPKGKLRITNRSENYKYYIRSSPKDRNGKYVPKSKMSRAREIAQRDYNQMALNAVCAEIEAIEQLLKVWDIGRVEEIHDKLILPRRELVVPPVKSDAEYAKAWLAEDYPRKGFAANSPEFYSASGVRVRSKSEALLLDRFDHFKVPSKFEYPTELYTGEVIHPDFTLLNVRLRQEFKFEHLGKCDDPAYMEYNIGRLNDLALSGYTLGKNLLITMETKNTPLNMKVVDRLIRTFLL